MIKKIRDYWELKKLYRNSKKVIVINSAETIISIRNIVSNIETLVEKNSSNINSISPEDITNISNFIKEITSNPDTINDKVWTKIHDDAQKLREMEVSKQESLLGR